MNRALETQNRFTRAAIWGCANFELNHHIAGSLITRRCGREDWKVWPWIDRFSKSARQRWTGMNAENWRRKFRQFVDTLRGRHVYITVDFDCLTPEDAVTDWEQGLFTADDLVWAIAQIRLGSLVVGGDICGAYSPASYARWTQRRTAQIDHPRNRRRIRRLLPSETGRRSSESGLLSLIPQPESIANP